MVLELSLRAIGPLLAPRRHPRNAARPDRGTGASMASGAALLGGGGFGETRPSSWRTARQYFRCAVSAKLAKPGS